MRTKKYNKNRRSRNNTKRRRNGGGWWGNIFKSKQQKEEERAEAERAAAERARIDKNIAAREIGATREKNIVEKQWQKENSEGWETNEEIQNKIKKIPVVELAQRTLNQKEINAFLQKEIATLQNDLGLCYPNGKNIVQNAKMKDLQDELYHLKDQETNLRLERKELKNLLKMTPQCKMQKKLAKEKWQVAPMSENDAPNTLEPEDVFYDIEDNDLEGKSEALAQKNEEFVEGEGSEDKNLLAEGDALEGEALEGEEFELESESLAERVKENAPEDFVLVSSDPITSPRKKKLTQDTCDNSSYDVYEINVCKACNTIKKIVAQLISSNNCKEIYLQPEKFYELVKKQVLDSIVQGNWFSVKTKIAGITLFLNAYPEIKKTVIKTLRDTSVFKALCEDVAANPNVDVDSVSETFTNQLIFMIMTNLITAYEDNPKVRNNIVWLQEVYYSYFEKRSVNQYSNTGGKRKKAGNCNNIKNMKNMKKSCKKILKGCGNSIIKKRKTRRQR